MILGVKTCKRNHLSMDPGMAHRGINHMHWYFYFTATSNNAKTSIGLPAHPSVLHSQPHNSQEQNGVLSLTAKSIRRSPRRAEDSSVACVTQSISSLRPVSVWNASASPSSAPLVTHERRGKTNGLSASQLITTIPAGQLNEARIPWGEWDESGILGWTIEIVESFQHFWI